MPASQPVAESHRIQSLDVLRGFALLGILLLNILGFGLHSAGYFNPLFGSGETELSRSVNLSIWAGVDVLFEGAMRCLFSILFGAGVVLFTSGETGKGARLHYARNFWLLIFGILDAYVLLWSGDILLTYALVGMVLYPLRSTAPRRLAISAGVLVVLMSLMGLLFSVGLDMSRQADAVLADAPSPPDAELLAAAQPWREFLADYDPDADAVAAELSARRGSYTSALLFTYEYMKEVLTFVLPVILFWDALAMMLLGMALFRWGVLDASRSVSFYLKLAGWGFGIGLAINGWELFQALASDLDPLAVHGNMRPTYHIGRLAMALGYIGVVMLVCKGLRLPGLRARLAAVGRMALTNCGVRVGGRSKNACVLTPTPYSDPTGAL